MTWVGRGSDKFLASNGALSFEGGETECGVMRFHHYLHASKIYRIYPQARCFVFMFVFRHLRPWFNFWIGKICWRRDRLPTPVFLGFPGGSAGKESACNVEDLGLIPGLGRSPGEGKGCSLQYYGLYNPWSCKESDTTEPLSALSLKTHFRV